MKIKYSGGNSCCQLYTADAMLNLMSSRAYSSQSIVTDLYRINDYSVVRETGCGVSQLRPRIRLLSLIHIYDANGGIRLVVIGRKTGRSRSQKVTPYQLWTACAVGVGVLVGGLVFQHKFIGGVTVPVRAEPPLAQTDLLPPPGIVAMDLTIYDGHVGDRPCRCHRRPGRCGSSVLVQ